MGYRRATSERSTLGWHSDWSLTASITLDRKRWAGCAVAATVLREWSAGSAASLVKRIGVPMTGSPDGGAAAVGV